MTEAEREELNRAVTIDLQRALSSTSDLGATRAALLDSYAKYGAIMGRAFWDEVLHSPHRAPGFNAGDLRLNAGVTCDRLIATLIRNNTALGVVDRPFQDETIRVTHGSFFATINWAFETTPAAGSA